MVLFSSFFQNLGFLSSLTYLLLGFYFFHFLFSYVFITFAAFHIFQPHPQLEFSVYLKRQINARGVFQLDFFNFICFVFFFCCATICQTRYANIFVFFSSVLLLFVVFRQICSAFVSFHSCFLLSFLLILFQMTAGMSRKSFRVFFRSQKNNQFYISLNYTFFRKCILYYICNIYKLVVCLLAFSPLPFACIYLFDFVSFFVDEFLKQNGENIFSFYKLDNKTVFLIFCLLFANRPYT